MISFYQSKFMTPLGESTIGLNSFSSLFWNGLLLLKEQTSLQRCKSKPPSKSIKLYFLLANADLKVLKSIIPLLLPGFLE